MADAFTVNSVTAKGPWLVADGYSADVSGTEQAIIANVTGAHHLVKHIAIDFANIGNWIKILDGSDLQIGPWESGSKHWSQDFGDGLTFEDGVYVETESSGKTHVTVIYKIVGTE